MAKIDRRAVFAKFGGLCAYTGKPLGDKWQVDHVVPKHHYQWYLSSGPKASPDDIENLLPAIAAVNHYKRFKTLEEFRAYMLSFHLRLAKVPKKGRVPGCRRDSGQIPVSPSM